MNPRNRRLHLASTAMLFVTLLFPALLNAQKKQPQVTGPIGTVSAADADVTAPLQTVDGKVLLSANTTVTAHDHTAEVDLERHGLVLVCATTALHINDSQTADGPLMLSIDRGAVELRILSRPGDVLMTPDLRIQSTSAGSLNLQMRVSRNGDTCMENKAITPDAPTLEIHAQMDDGMYLLHPGQHVLFNYGSLRQVVDNETLPCGCPTSTAGLGANSSTKTTAQSSKPEKYPFPLAQSEGLAPTPQPVPQQPGETSVTLKATMHMDGSQPPQTASAAPTTPTPPAPQKTGFFHSIGHFFKKIFGTQ